MAYSYLNPSYTYGQVPGYYTGTPTYQPTMTAQPTPTVSQQPNGGIVCYPISGEEAVNSYLVAPNQSVWLIDMEKGTFYIKSADGSGMPLPVRIFDYKERTKEPVASEPCDFVTHDELKEMMAELKASLAKGGTTNGRKSSV